MLYLISLIFIFVGFFTINGGIKFDFPKTSIQRTSIAMGVTLLLFELVRMIL